jgi:hypothetical protein
MIEKAALAGLEAAENRDVKRLFFGKCRAPLAKTVQRSDLIAPAQFADDA